jgi:hypothetical protein
MANNKVTPLANWDTEDTPYEEGLIWWSRLDGKYQIEVHGIEDKTHTGKLYIFDHDNDNNVLHEEEVGLSYGAVFGPDVSDVNTWQKRVVELVDSW